MYGGSGYQYQYIGQPDALDLVPIVLLRPERDQSSQGREDTGRIVLVVRLGHPRSTVGFVCTKIEQRAKDLRSKGL